MSAIFPEAAKPHLVSSHPVMIKEYERLLKVLEWPMVCTDLGPCVRHLGLRQFIMKEVREFPIAFCPVAVESGVQDLSKCFERQIP